MGNVHGYITFELCLEVYNLYSEISIFIETTEDSFFQEIKILSSTKLILIHILNVVIDLTRCLNYTN